MALVEAAGTVRMASPTSIGLMRRSQGVTRWSDKNARGGSGRGSRSERRQAAGRGRSEAAERSRDKRTIPTDAVTLIVTGTVIQENVRNEIDDAAATSVCEAGLGVDVDEQSAETGALEVNRTSWSCGSRSLARGWR